MKGGILGTTISVKYKGYFVRIRFEVFLIKSVIVLSPFVSILYYKGDSKGSQQSLVSFQ